MYIFDILNFNFISVNHLSICIYLLYLSDCKLQNFADDLISGQGYIIKIKKFIKFIKFKNSVKMLKNTMNLAMIEHSE